MYTVKRIQNSNCENLYDYRLENDDIVILLSFEGNLDFYMSALTRKLRRSLYSPHLHLTTRWRYRLLQSAWHQIRDLQSGLSCLSVTARWATPSLSSTTRSTSARDSSARWS